MINLGKMSKIGKEVILEERENGCMECISHCKDEDGYTRIRYKEKHERLFRVIYEQKYGEIPKGMVIRHKCDNPWCCNIEHLEIGTQYDNIQDMIKRGRAKWGTVKLYGEQNPSHKLTKKQVEEIYLSIENANFLSKKYKISKTMINFIKNKKYWSKVTDKLD